MVGTFVAVPEHAPDFDPFVHAADRDDITVVLDPVAETMGGGFCVLRGGHTLVVLAPRLDAAERREALTHELVHGERGGGADRSGSPPTWAAVVARDEVAVNRVVAERLVPPGRLRRVVEELLTERDGVDIAAVAAAFEVSPPIAELALLALRHADGVRARSERGRPTRPGRR